MVACKLQYTGMIDKKPPIFIILDGNALLHRAFHALPPMTTKDGTLVNAVYGFTSILLKIIKDFQPDYLCAAFDRKGESKRKLDFSAYKAQRVKQPDELYSQIPIIEEVLATFGIPVIDAEESGYEADDVIGTVVKKLKKEDLKKIIVTGDLDTLQLIDDNTEIFTSKKGLNDTVIYTDKEVLARYGLHPEQMIDYKALRGDPSDNIPGVKGIGEKTAVGLIKQLGSLKNLYQKLDEAKVSPRILDLLKTQKDEAFLSKKLVTIKTDLKTNFKLKDAVLQPIDKDKVRELFSRLEFHSLFNKLPNNSGADEQSATEPSLQKKNNGLNYNNITTDKDFQNFLTALKKQTIFSIDTETTSLNVREAKLLGISFSWEANVAYYLNLGQQKKPVFETWLAELKPILLNEQIKKVGHNLKYDYAILAKYDLKMNGLEFDTMLGAYLLSSGSRGLSLDTLVFAELAYKMQSIEDLIGKKGKGQLTMDLVDPAKVAWYSCEDADFTFKLKNKLETDLEKSGNLGLLKKLEMPLVPVLATMENNGIKIDIKKLNELDTWLSAEIKKLETKIYKLAGQEFNIASPKQLQDILFNVLNISSLGIKKTKTSLSTAADELEKLKDAHPIIPLISEFREYSKLQNTYTQTLPLLIDEHNRVHTSFNQTGTATGRLSSSEPNLQNIPIRTELGKKIRHAFIAELGFKLIAADYSQIELRIIASLADDKAMIQSFINNEDIHRRTAAGVLDKPLAEVTPEERRNAKEINFGIIYGLGANGLAMRTGLSRADAKKFITAYFDLHPQIKNWLDNTKVIAAELGYVETLFGRRRFLPDITSGVSFIRASAERMAINAPVQGTAADLLKLAMVKIADELPKISPRSKMLLTVHDELVLETPEDEAETVAQKVKEIMENIYLLKVPIKVEVGIADNWGDCK